MRSKLLGTGAALFLAVSLAGCSAGLSGSYSLEERMPVLSAPTVLSEEELFAPAFARDLCVVGDEQSYAAASEVTESSA